MTCHMHYYKYAALVVAFFLCLLLRSNSKILLFAWYERDKGQEAYYANALNDGGDEECVGVVVLVGEPSAKSGAFILFPLAMPRLLSYCLACNHAAISQTRDTRSQAMVDCLCTHVALQEASEDHAEQRAL